MFGFCWEAHWVFIMIVRSMIFQHGRLGRGEASRPCLAAQSNVIASLEKYNAP